MHNALTDPAYTVPPVPTGGPTPGIRWLRRNVARFTDGPDHARRRRLVTDLLAGADLTELRGWAAEYTRAIVRQTGPVDLMTEVARVVPVEVLCAVLGLPSAPASSVAVIARAYQPGTGAEEPADEAVAELVEAFGGIANEATASTIALLAQACDATAGLIGNAVLRAATNCLVDGVVAERQPDASLPSAGTVAAADLVENAALTVATNCLVDAVVAETLRQDPPVRMTRRQVAGTVVAVDLAGLPFGAGPHECPGREHAQAIAAGILEAVRGCRLVDPHVEYEPSVALRVPVALVVMPGGG
jgi:cytochrome P450